MDLELTYDVVDLEQLPSTDMRRGFGSPTILFNGRDLFGTGSPGPTMSCRLYKEGTPTPTLIAEHLHDRLPKK
jgi:hypothetical protein